MQNKRLVGQQQLLYRCQARHRADVGRAALFTQRCPYAPKLLGELVACVENALPLPRERLAIALVGRQDALGQSEQLRLLPGGLLVLNGLQALCRPFAVFGGLDGLAGQASSALVAMVRFSRTLA